MVKKLRSREIDAETEQKAVFPQKTILHVEVRPIQKIKKTILRKFHSGGESLKKQQRFLQQIESEDFSTLLDQSRLECPICLELMVQPTMMICGHMYCYRCLDSNTAYSERCSLCRQPQLDAPHIPSRLAEIIINKYVLFQSSFLLPHSAQVIPYLCRTTDSNQWAKRRFVRHLRPGQIVDFHDSFYLWQKAVIVKTFLDKSGKAFVDVKTNVKGDETTETIEASSKRLAPAKFFTKGRYLEEFQPSIPEYDYHHRQLYSLQYREEVLDDDFFRKEPRGVDFMLGESAEENAEEQIESAVCPANQNFLDALVLFDMQMQENELSLD